MNGSAGPTKAEKYIGPPWHERDRDRIPVNPQTTALYFAHGLLCCGAVLAWWLVAMGTSDCAFTVLDAQLAGTSERFRSASLKRTCDLAGFNDALWADLIFDGMALGLLAVTLLVWWNSSWDSEPGYSRISGRVFVPIAAVAMLAEIVDHILMLNNVDEAASGGLTLGAAPVIFTLSWIKWILIVVLLVAAGLITLLWLARAIFWHRAKDTPEAQKPVLWQAPDPAPDLGICLSGGGIRSAAFGLGALSTLEETPVQDAENGWGLLGKADLLASVSGGGYAATAWRIAAGTSKSPGPDRPFIGDPNDFPTSGSDAAKFVGPTAEPASFLYPLIRRRREYLRTGRGGLLRSALTFLAQGIWHLAMIMIPVWVIAWPIGRLIGSDLINTSSGVEYGRLFTPTVLIISLVVPLLIGRLFTETGTARAAIDVAIASITAIAALVAFSLVIAPWMVLYLLPGLQDLMPGSSRSLAERSAVSAVLGSGVAASAWKVLQAPIRARALYLGGVLLAISIGLFSLAVAADAAADDGFLNWGLWPWAAVAGAIAILYTVVNPDLWSLHAMYRNHLGFTFVNRWTGDRWEPKAPRDYLAMSDYVDAPGPRQVICAVAGRDTREVTGVPVVSMTFEPDHVALHLRPGIAAAIPSADYEDIHKGKWRERRARKRSRLITLTALSGAAVAPQMGRLNVGSTNALIAALNARLGQWMPNPAFTGSRRHGTDIAHMFKELLGQYNVHDSNVYVTDGGHWENLGLVELIRRRTKAIICIDASLDPLHSFAVLLEAMELAELECEATVTLVGDGLDGMRPGGADGTSDEVIPDRNWAVATIEYPGGVTGRLLFVKCQASRQLPIDVLRYAKEDPNFPHYSTGNQFLAEEEFANLAVLGRESTREALVEYKDWLFRSEAAEAPSTLDITDQDQPAIVISGLPSRRVAPAGVKRG